MEYLGEKKRNETIRIPLGGMDKAPDSTPQIRIEQNGTLVLDYTNMTSIVGTFNYYYDHTIASNATVGSYQVYIKVIVDSLTKIFIDTFDVSVYDTDDIKSDTEIIIANLNISNGLYSIIVNVKDTLSNPIEGAKISIHNSNNDDSPLFATVTTDNLGNCPIVNLNQATYTLRITKPNHIVSSTTTIDVTQSETFNKTVSLITVTPPTDPDLCRLVIFTKTLSITNDESLKIIISSYDKLTKISGQFIMNTSMRFNYDKTSDFYYFDAVQGAYVKIYSEELGMSDVKILVPSSSTQDLSGLIS